MPRHKPSAIRHSPSLPYAIRRMTAVAILAGTVAAGVATAPPAAPAPAQTTIRIASFNIQVLGKTKVKKRTVMETLARVAREFDVVAVQELRDATGRAAQKYLDRINRDAEVPYAMVVGPRLGRSSSKEQYVIYYRTGVVAFVDSFTVPDAGDRFERPPLVARFVAGQFDFRLVVSHIKPSDAPAEMAALAEVAGAVLDPTERDVIVLGDLNADCDYFDPTDEDHAFRAGTFHWVVPDGVKTAVRTACTYDRIVLLDGTFGSEYVPGSGRVFRYDEEYGISDDALVRAVSDHYPVFAEYRVTGPDDDGEEEQP